MPFPIMAAIAGASALGSLLQGRSQAKKANEAQRKAQEFAEQRYRERAPLRLQGMQALGQVEAPIDFGGQFRNTANPFSRATPSTASYGNWGQQMTTSPEAMQAALAGLQPLGTAQRRPPARPLVGMQPLGMEGV